MQWPGSVVLISGASRGIGAELARHAVRKGAKVGLLARNVADLEALKAELGPGSAIAQADVCDPEQIAVAVKQIEGELGPIDILVNNAGIGLYGAFLDVDVHEAERLVQTNVMGVIHLTKAVLPGMVSRRRGHHVMIGSIAGRIGSPFEAVYAGTKFAAVGMAEALAIEVLPFNIGTSIINPGPVSSSFGEARGHVYDREKPRPISTAVVADAIIRAVEKNTFEIYLPKSLGPAVKIRHLLPSIFRFGTSKAFKKELAAEKSRA